MKTFEFPGNSGTWALKPLRFTFAKGYRGWCVIASKMKGADEFERKEYFISGRLAPTASQAMTFALKRLWVENPWDFTAQVSA